MLNVIFCHLASLKIQEDTSFFIEQGNLTKQVIVKTKKDKDTLKKQQKNREENIIELVTKRRHILYSLVQRNYRGKK